MRTAAMLLGLTVILGGCVEEPAAALPPGTAQMERRLREPGLGLAAMGNMANELGERYEEAGQFDQAEAYYRIATWAYGQVGALTGREPLLLDDARSSLQRVQTARSKPTGQVGSQMGRRR